MDSVSLERPGKVIVCLNELSLLSCLNYHVYFLYRHTHTRVKRVVVNYLEGSQDPLLSLKRIFWDTFLLFCKKRGLRIILLAFKTSRHGNENGI